MIAIVPHQDILFADSNVENLSASSLRRKLFDGENMDEDDDDEDNVPEDDDDGSDKENGDDETGSDGEASPSAVGGPLAGISPGAVMLTPKATGCGSAQQMAQGWSLSSFEVSRHLLTNYLNQVKSVSLPMTSLTALANEVFLT